MESYSYGSCPESGNSSPRSREIEYENPPPWDDPQLSYKVKFMCSYDGKIHPRSHDNQLSYVGGETKILSVDRNIKFSAFLAKLSSLCDSDVTFKYQLPGEDLDALISVTNDDDLDHMMHEFDRLYRSSGKQARIRLFLLPFSRNQSFNSDGSRSDREQQFVEDLNSAPNNSIEPVKPLVQNNVDFLFGLDKGISPPPQPQPPPVAVKLQDQQPEPVAPPPDFSRRPVPGDRIVSSDPIQNQIEMPRHMQEFQRLQIHLEHEQGLYARKNEENLGGYSGDYYIQKMPDKTLPVPSSAAGSPQLTAPAGYWPENNISNGGFPATVTTTPGAPPELYMLQAPGTLFHPSAPTMRPMTLPATNQGYYAMHRMPSDPYREHQMYNMTPHPVQQLLSQAPQPTVQSQPSRGVAYSEGISVARPNIGGGNMGMISDTGPYTQVAYDSASGRQVFYTVAGGVVQQQQVPSPYSTVPVGGGGGARIGQDGGQFVTKTSPGSV